MVAKQKILIVDDDNNIAELISLYLTKECYETMIVNDGEEALKVFDTFKPQNFVKDFALGGQHDDRRARLGADLSADLIAVDARQHQIQ